MTPDEAYHRLIGLHESFEAHVLASILALSLADTRRPLSEAAGYDGIPAVLFEMFPHASDILTGASPLRRSDDEQCLLDLLVRGASTGSPLELLLAGMIARRAQRPNHLWQDLGLRNRNELSRLMFDYFGPLARRNRQDMKWKKFFFRTICRDAAYSLCTAPSCAECCDFDNCFNEESGESLLAHLRRSAEATN